MIEGRSRKYLVNVAKVGSERKRQHLHFRGGAGLNVRKLPVSDQNARLHGTSIDHPGKLVPSRKILAGFLVHIGSNDDAVDGSSNFEVLGLFLRHRELLLEASAVANYLRRLAKVRAILIVTEVAAGER